MSIASFPLGDKTNGEAEDLLDVPRREDATHPLRMQLGERRLDQVAPLQPAPLEDERPQRLEEADLGGRVRGVACDELLEPPRYQRGPPLQRLDAEDVPDQLLETCPTD